MDYIISYSPVVTQKTTLRLHIALKLLQGSARTPLIHLLIPSKYKHFRRLSVMQWLRESVHCVFLHDILNKLRVTV